MAATTRRYFYDGPNLPNLRLATDSGLTVAALPYVLAVDVTFDGAVADVAAVDAQMLTVGLVPDVAGTIAASPTPFFGWKSGAGNFWKAESDATGVYIAEDVAGVFTERARINTGQALFQDGTVAAPGVSFLLDTNLGVYRVGADQMGFAANGVQQMLVTTQGVGFKASAAVSPSIFVIGDTDTGIAFPAADTVEIASAGANMVKWTSAGGGVYERQQYTTVQVLTYVSGGTTLVDATRSNVFTLTLTNATTQLGNPSNLVAGMTFVFVITQDGAGARALTFDTAYSFGAAGAPDLTTSGAGVVDIISAVAISAAKLVCVTSRGF